MPLESVRELTRHAYNNGYALGYFESWNLESLEGVVDAAEQSRSPAIIGFNGQFLTDAGRTAEERLEWYAALGQAAAESASVPCGFIFNECPEDRWILRAVALGFNLVMPTDSRADYGRYVQRVGEITEYAHANGAAVEAEIDVLPCGAPHFGDDHRAISETDPNLAAEFVAATDVDLLAVSVGNVHISLNGRERLNLERLEQIKRSVGVPLVLHGGTGVPDADLKEAIRMGVAKVNFGTYLKQRYIVAVRQALDSAEVNPHVLYGLGGKDDVMVAGRTAVRDAVMERIHLLGCCGKA